MDVYEEYDFTTPKTPECRWKHFTKDMEHSVASPDLAPVSESPDHESFDHESSDHESSTVCINSTVDNESDEDLINETTLLDKTMHLQRSCYYNLNDTESSGFEDSRESNYLSHGIANCKLSVVTVDASTQISTPPPYESVEINERHYDLIKVIGNGVCTKVYRALNVNCKECVIKIIDVKNCTESEVDGFSNEVRMLERLQHLCPYTVVKMYDYYMSKTNNLISVIMERGEVDLHTVVYGLHRRKRATPTLVKFYAKQALLAIHELHVNSIVHLDVKPANFILVSGEVKIIDFGLSIDLKSKLSTPRKNNQAGTMNYLSPEILDGRRYDISAKADIWSFGCMLHEFQYGKTPFTQTDTCPDSILKNLYTPIHLPRDDKDLYEILNKCLQINPKDRPSSTVLLASKYFNF